MLERKTVSQCPTSDYCKGWNDAVDALPKWISVKERLPEHGSMAIAHTLHFYAVLQWDEKCELWFSAHSVHGKDFVTHWMPLPEPPKEDK